MLPTIEWQSDAVVMVDQRKLPGQEVYVRCKTAAEVARAIKTMVIRGAPAIGVAAAMGLALGVRQSTATGTTKLAGEFYKLCEMIADAASSGQSADQIKDRLAAEARTIHDEDVASCRAMGSFGETVVPDAARVLT